MGLWTQKPETRGNNPTILLPEPNPNLKIETRPIPETRHSKPENPGVFQVSEFLSKYRIRANTTLAAYKKMRVLWWDFTK